MCLAIPGQITELRPESPGLATVEVGGVRRRVNTELLQDEGLDGGPLRVGDWVLLHVGFAMSRLSDAEAQEQLHVLSALGEAQQALEEVHGYQS